MVLDCFKRDRLGGGVMDNSISKGSAYLMGAGGCAIASIITLGLAISQPKPFRALSGLMPFSLAVGGAVLARKGAAPTEIEEMERIAQVTVREAQIVNLLEDVSMEDDMERQLKFRGREIAIEAQELEQLGPIHVQIQRMRRDLGLDPIYPVGMPVGYGVMPIGQFAPPQMQQPPIEVNASPQIDESAPAPPKWDSLDDVATHRGHLVISSRTQSGKTSTILGAVDRKQQRQGYANLTVIDPKKTYWMGLENMQRPGGQPRLVDLSMARPADSEKLLGVLHWAQKLQEKRQTERLECRKSGRSYEPQEEIIAIDEWPACLAMARSHDANMKVVAKNEGEAWQSVEQQIIQAVEMLLFTSAEDRIYVWILAQSHRCNVLGINDGLRANMAVWAQGRLNEMQSVEAALADAWLIPQGDSRKTLSSQFQMLMQQQNETPIFYTNLGGHKIGRLPDLSHIKTKQVFQGGTVAPPQASIPPPNILPNRSDLDNLFNQSAEDIPDDEW